VLKLQRLEVEGFGPFASRQVLTFPDKPGVTVVYGENMRGKTSLLNAIRYAFFGVVLGRGSRPRRLHNISNRDNAAKGDFGFSVTLAFEHDGDAYVLSRRCKPRVAAPANDEDYEVDCTLRKGNAVLGPQERDAALQLVFPKDISRFFLFDGELLQEYEELLINESTAGPRISAAIERILKVPVLTQGRDHLLLMSNDADKQAAREASKSQETLALGTALQQATEQREAHQRELARLQKDLEGLQTERAEIEQLLQSTQKYGVLLEERDRATSRLADAQRDEQTVRAELQRLMAEAWRSVLREPVRTARTAAQADAHRELDAFALSLRAKALESGHCDTCDQDIPPDVASRLRTTLSAQPVKAAGDVFSAMSRLGELNRFVERNDGEEVKRLWKRLRGLEIEQVTLTERISDLKAALADANPDLLRRARASYTEVIEKTAAVKRGIDGEQGRITEIDQNIQRLNKRLEGAGTSDLRASQARAKVLRDAAEVLSAAVDRYKSEKRKFVEASATKLFLSMTTEEHDYASLSINESYGLAIIHKDGQREEARSAGAEHVVALALMGALQQNAPLRGPIVMDSPFGRLDEQHTNNVIQTLPQMAEQVVLLVYEAEVGKQSMRELLGKCLLKEYELEKVSARRTNIREVK
jgi:DNA sulfur modification protein DndD